MLTHLKYHALTASAWWLNMHSRSIQPSDSCQPHGNIWIMTLPCTHVHRDTGLRMYAHGQVARSVQTGTMMSVHRQEVSR